MRRAAVSVLLGVVGSTAALLLAGRVDGRLGPFEAATDLRLSWSGDTVVQVGPLGSIRLDTHDGPLRLVARLDELRPDEARRIARDPTRELSGVEDEIAADARRLVRRLVLQAALAAVLGGAVLAAVRHVGARAAAVGGAAGAVLVASCGVTAVVSWRPDALAEPRYTGLLSAAPSAVGTVEDITARFGRYRSQLAALVSNLAELYQAADALPDFEPRRATVRLLHVTDVHLNPAAWDLAARLAEQFDVDAVVDTGDTTDWGTTPESQLVGGIGRIPVPYVWVRGNHDSPATQAAVAAQPNAVVLDRTSTTVAGLRIWGVGDPRFTPDKREGADIDEERAGADRYAPTVRREVRRAEPPSIDVVLVHDVRIAASLGGTVPLVLAGHSDKPRARSLGDGTLALVQGSSGGEGLRGLEGDEATPLTASVLYFDPSTKRLVAYDQVTVAGLGGTAATIKRHLVEGGAR